MITFIAMSVMNSILEAGKTCDDTMAILERMNNQGGVQVVPDGDPRADDVEVAFMYPFGARQAYSGKTNHG